MEARERGGSRCVFGPRTPPRAASSWAGRRAVLGRIGRVAMVEPEWRRSWWGQRRNRDEGAARQVRRMRREVVRGSGGGRVRLRPRAAITSKEREELIERRRGWEKAPRAQQHAPSVSETVSMPPPSVPRAPGAGGRRGEAGTLPARSGADSEALVANRSAVRGGGPTTVQTASGQVEGTVPYPISDPRRTRTPVASAAAPLSSGNSGESQNTPLQLRPPAPDAASSGRPGERERETFFLFRLCKQATYIIRAQDTVTALLQVQTIEGVGQLGGLNEL